MAATDNLKGDIKMPISANFSGGHIYTGPSGTYVKAVTNASGQSVEILWKEGNFFYVRYIGPQNIRVQGYVPDTNISSISGGNYSVFYPTINEDAKRYVSQNANAFLGESTTYNTIYPPEYGQAVYYLGKKIGSLAFIEYINYSTAAKYRAWFPHASLATGQIIVPGRYVAGQVINSSRDNWGVSNGWNGSSGHLGIDVRPRNSSNYYYSNSDARGTYIYSIADGIVVLASENTGGDYYDVGTGKYYHGNGKCIIIRHTTDQQKTYYSMYCHLNSISVQVNSFISKNQVIGTMGSTGRVDGTGTSNAVVHLHLNITKDSIDAGAWGYYRDSAGNQTHFNGTDSVVYNGIRYFNPTSYFGEGDVLINRFS